MSDTVIDINALPSLLFRMFDTSRVSISKTEGGIHVMPMKEDNSIDGLIGILSEYPEMSVDNFLTRMRADKELDL
ncbi:MAG: hypothetical protein FWB96_10145 [Defluviitaleaceae bacterium]|nr:hypothetical protein [Defluviitaleaceae bacterium]MCL2263233.1 hypothetical protein [Defluviitaleaceae bacterium]